MVKGTSWISSNGEWIPKKIRCLSSGENAKGKEKAKVITELRQEFDLDKLLQLAKIPRSSYYYYLKKNKTDKYSREKKVIKAIFMDNKERYGYRRITMVMHNEGYHINHKTVSKLMNMLGLKAKQRKNGKYHSYKGIVGTVAKNILDRKFTANKPFEKLTTDVTQFNIGNDKVYLSPVMDLFNREIVSYSISRSPNLYQIREMLDGLYKKLPKGSKPLFHSDQGWQYQQKEYVRSLKEHNIIQSMSRKGNCMDNGAMENFFGRLKVEMFYGEKFESTSTFIKKLEEYLDYYNNDRIVAKLKMSPVQYRTHLYQ